MRISVRDRKIDSSTGRYIGRLATRLVGMLIGRLIKQSMNAYIDKLWEREK